MLASITIENFRCIQGAALDFDIRGTGIVGPNASGKTAFLEAIYFLAHGRSFRTPLRARMVGPSGRSFRISASLEREGLRQNGGVEYSGQKLRARLGGHELEGISALTRELPVQIIDPAIHRVIEEGAGRRRRLMDWGVFHVEQNFLVPWRRYNRALLQRNAALRQGVEAVDTWAAELRAAGEVIDAHRSGYVEKLQPLFERAGSELLGLQVALGYERGWDPDLSLDAALKAAESRDRRIRATSAGAHRADLIFKLEGRPARDWVSRGQQKMLAIAFVLAQIELRAAINVGPSTCLLLDDPAAELDVDNLGKLLAALSKLPAQLVVTSLTPRGLAGLPTGRMFHVKQGIFSPML